MTPSHPPQKSKVPAEHGLMLSFLYLDEIDFMWVRFAYIVYSFPIRGPRTVSYLYRKSAIFVNIIYDTRRIPYSLCSYRSMKPRPRN